MIQEPHILLDAARMDGLIYQAIELNEQYRCLYEGDSAVVLGSVAPYLFELDRYSHFADWLIEHGANDHWGIIIHSDVEEQELYRHLRKFLIVEQEAGKELYFRFYDPRVLRDFLPTCDTNQLEEFFGPVESYVMEDEKGQMVHFQLEGGELQTHQLEMDLKFYLLNPDGFLARIERRAPKSEEKADKKEGKWDFG